MGFYVLRHSNNKPSTPRHRETDVVRQIRSLSLGSLHPRNQGLGSHAWLHIPVTRCPCSDSQPGSLGGRPQNRSFQHLLTRLRCNLLWGRVVCGPLELPVQSSFLALQVGELRPRKGKLETPVQTPRVLASRSVALLGILCHPPACWLLFP